MIIGRWIVFITTSTGLGILLHEAGLDSGLSVVGQVIVGATLGLVSAAVACSVLPEQDES